MKALLSRLMSKRDSEIREMVQTLDASHASRGLRRRFEKIRAKQGGFTLLELLVVVAILATIAATATILLEDTDRKASAAAHVTIMDELTKGLATYRVLHQGVMPNNWDSMLVGAGTLAATTLPVATDADFGLDDALANPTNGMLQPIALDPAAGGTEIVAALVNVGIEDVQVINTASADPNGGNPGDCSTLALMRDMIGDKASDVTNSAMFSTAGGTRAGCGVSVPITAALTNNLVRLRSTENYRVGADATDTLIALGFGSSNDLFQPENLGAMTGAPFYRHVDGFTYNRFIALFNVGGAAPATWLTEARLQAVIDGSGDTKEEELGEWDNTRSTL